MGRTKSSKTKNRERWANVDLNNLQFYFQESQTGYQQYKCLICNTLVTGALGVRSHLSGQPHKKGVKNYFQSEHWKCQEDKVLEQRRISELGPKLVEECEMDPFLIWNGMLKSKLYDKFYCQLCKKEMSSVDGALSHVDGKDHLKRCRLPDMTRIIPACVVSKIEGLEEFQQFRDPKIPPPKELMYSKFCRYCGIFQEEGVDGCKQHFDEMDKLNKIIVRNK